MIYIINNTINIATGTLYGRYVQQLYLWFCCTHGAVPAWGRFPAFKANPFSKSP